MPVFLINPVNIKCYMRNELGGDNYSVWYEFDVTYAFMWANKGYHLIESSSVFSFNFLKDDEQKVMHPSLAKML